MRATLSGFGGDVGIDSKFHEGPISSGTWLDMEFAHTFCSTAAPLPGRLYKPPNPPTFDHVAVRGEILIRAGVVGAFWTGHDPTCTQLVYLDLHPTLQVQRTAAVSSFRRPWTRIPVTSFSHPYCCSKAPSDVFVLHD